MYVCIYACIYLKCNPAKTTHHTEIIISVVILKCINLKIKILFVTFVTE